MTIDKKIYTIDDLILKVKKYIENESDIEDIKRAYYYAEEIHKDKLRKNGELEITHPLNVAIILTSVKSDKDTIIASLLHECLKSGDNIESIKENFGDTVAKLVTLVDQLGHIRFSTKNDFLVEYYKKIVVGMSEDVRVIVIKLADRLHNMRTLYALPIDKQKKIAKETHEILAPLAEHLGIHKIKQEIDDLCLRYLKPDVYYDISEKLNNTKLERDQAVSDMISNVSNMLDEHEIKHEIKGRSKSIYSIYKKMNSGKKFSDIYDFLALRVLVNTEQECYLVLGLIHSKYKPVPKRFKDYIANPKKNGYQSLHTTVFGEDGNLFEIQIRTFDMHTMAENGVAAHWAYKEHVSADRVLKNVTDQKLQFFKAIMELNEGNVSDSDFEREMNLEDLNNSIYVYTPKGDVFELPKGSTPIDFAYRIHSKVGDTMVGATVNDTIVPLDHELQTNDIVKIMTNKNGHPSKEWIKMCKTVQARSKIKNFFTKSERDVYIERGKDILEKELRKKKIPYLDFYNDTNKKILFEEFKCENDEEFFLQIGNGKNSVNSIINFIYKEDKEEDVPKKYIAPKNNDADIIVSGIDNIKVNLSNCCTPVKGDEIIGYITKGNGITIHRKVCHNVASREERLLNVEWNNIDNNKKYLTSIVIYTNTKDNNLLDIMQKINLYDIQVENVTSRRVDHDAVYELDIYVKNKEKLDILIRNLENISYVDEVERIIK